jgi:hypothetical protein
LSFSTKPKIDDAAKENTNGDASIKDEDKHIAGSPSSSRPDDDVVMVDADEAVKGAANSTHTSSDVEDGDQTGRLHSIRDSSLSTHFAISSIYTIH